MLSRARCRNVQRGPSPCAPVRAHANRSKVRIRTRRRTAGSARRRSLGRLALRGVRSARSVVDALIAKILARTNASSFRWPCFSRAGTKMGNNAFRRLPHSRSDASHRMISAACAAFIVKWPSILRLPTRIRRLRVEFANGRLGVVTGHCNELVQNLALLLGCRRQVVEYA